MILTKLSYGLTERDLQTIYSILQSCPAVKEVRLFGSRAKGDYKNGSDIDMAVMNDGVTSEMLSALMAKFEESSLPYTVDVVYYPSLVHQALKEHIDRVGVRFYNRK